MALNERQLPADGNAANGNDLAPAIRDFISSYSIECTPGQADKIPSFKDILPAGTAVYLTFLSGTDYKDIVTVAKRLREEGFEPVPHFAARNIPDRVAFEDYVNRATSEAGVTRALAIAGAPNQPTGEYVDSMQLLETGFFDAYGIRTIGVAGHPERCPDCSDNVLLAALRWKNSFAQRTDANLHVVTQFCFEARPLIAYDRLLRTEGITLPIHVGVAGIASIKTLLKYALSCGVGNSVDFIRKQAQNVTKLLKPTAPDKLLVDLANYVAKTPETSLKSTHVFPLGGLRKSTDWFNAVANDAFAVNPKGDGIVLDPSKG